MKDKLIEMWLLAMHDPTLCSEAKAHVEAVLGAEFRCWAHVENTRRVTK